MTVSRVEGKGVECRHRYAGLHCIAWNIIVTAFFLTIFGTRSIEFSFVWVGLFELHSTASFFFLLAVFYFSLNWAQAFQGGHY
jgi:hypothetical protein